MNIPNDDYSSPEEEYNDLEARVRRAAQARMDQIAYRLDRTYGLGRTAQRLGVSTTIVTRRRNRHKEKLMTLVIPQSEDITTTPALTYLTHQGTLHVTAVGDAGALAQISIDLTRPEHEMLEQLADEISPWLPTLDALTEADQHDAAADQVQKALDRYNEAVRAERDGRATGFDVQDADAWLEETVVRASRSTDVDPQQWVQGKRGEAAQARRRAVQNAPGPVPELLMWVRPRVRGEYRRPVSTWMKVALSV